MLNPLYMAIDIGGTKTAFGFISEEGEIIYRNEILTGNSSDPLELIGRLTKIISENFDVFKENFFIKGAGIGAPNANYFKGTVEHAPNLKWKGIIPLARIFKENVYVH